MTKPKARRTLQSVLGGLDLDSVACSDSEAAAFKARRECERIFDRAVRLSGEATGYVDRRGVQIMRGDVPIGSPSWDRMERAKQSSRSRFVILTGPSGVGKTTAALRWIVMSSGSISLCHASDLARRVDPWKGDAREPVNLRSRLMLLDDLAQDKSARFTKALERLARIRSGGGRITVITSREPAGDMVEWMTDDVKNRMRGITSWAQVDGDPMWGSKCYPIA